MPHRRSRPYFPVPTTKHYRRVSGSNRDPARCAAAAEGQAADGGRHGLARPLVPRAHHQALSQHVRERTRPGALCRSRGEPGRLKPADPRPNPHQFGK
jgi:hypothetical protein